MTEPTIGDRLVRNQMPHGTSAWALQPSAESASRRPAELEEDGQALTLAVACAGTFLVLVAFTDVLPTVAETSRALHAGASGQTWILSAISLGLASALLTLGGLADNAGRRRVFRCSLLGLVGASVLAAVAPNAAILIIARLLEGFAGAGTLAAGLGLVGHTYGAGPARTRATGLWGAMIGAGIAVGPAASAALADLASWRTVHWCVAAAAATLLPAAARLPESRQLHKHRLDFAGALTFASAMAALTAGLTVGRESFAQTSAILLLVSAVVLLAVFVVIERSAREPVLDLRLFARPLFIASTSGALFTGLGLIAPMSFLPLMLQKAYDQSPLSSAGTLALWSVPSVAVAVQARRLPLRLSAPTRLAIGFLLCAVGVAALSTVDMHSPLVAFAPGLIIAGVGSGLANAALGRLAVESVPAGRTAIGSGANNTARYLGGAAGIAAIVALVSAGHDAPGARGLIDGWDLAALVAAVLCLVAAVIAVGCSLLASGDAPG